MQQIKIKASCQPVPAADETQTLACAGTLTNPGPETLDVLAVGVVPGGTTLDMRPYTLAGGFSVNLPAPPSGGFWVIASEPQGASKMRAFWTGIGQGVLWGFAGIGVFDVGAAIYQAAKRRRRGY